MRFFFEETEEVEGLQMAPMIDVVFLLLIFFMCVTTFSRIESELHISLPSTLSGTYAKTSPKNLTVNISAEGIISIGGKEYSQQSFKEYLAVAVANSNILQVVIRGDKDAKHGDVMTALDSCVGVGITDVKLRTKTDSNNAR